MVLLFFMKKVENYLHICKKYSTFVADFDLLCIMKTKNLRYIPFILVLLALSSSVYGAEGRRLVWKQRSNSQNGLYTTKNYFVTDGVSLNVSGMYYFGDVDNEGVAFNG